MQHFLQDKHPEIYARNGIKARFESTIESLDIEPAKVTLSFDHLMANMELNLNFNMKDAQTKKPISDLRPYLGAVHPTDDKSSGPDAQFMATFPHSGVFKIWGQFQENGKVFTAPFVVKVP
jgi:hypothetical protein